MPRPRNTEAKAKAIGRHRSKAPKPRKRFTEERAKHAAMIRGQAVADPIVETADVGTMQPPSWLSDRDRQTWHALLPSLTSRRLIAPSDAMIFARYCQWLGTWLDTATELRGRKLVRIQRTLRVKGMQRTDKHFDAMLKIDKVLIDLEDRLAMNPRSRIAIMEKIANVPAVRTPADQAPANSNDDGKRSPVGFLKSTPPPKPH